MHSTVWRKIYTICVLGHFRLSQTRIRQLHVCVTITRRITFDGSPKCQIVGWDRKVTLLAGTLSSKTWSDGDRSSQRTVAVCTSQASSMPHCLIYKVDSGSLAHTMGIRSCKQLFHWGPHPRTILGVKERPSCFSCVCIMSLFSVLKASVWDRQVTSLC